MKNNQRMGSAMTISKYICSHQKDSYRKYLMKKGIGACLKCASEGLVPIVPWISDKPNFPEIWMKTFEECKDNRGNRDESQS
jgi:hypothetical protein